MEIDGNSLNTVQGQFALGMAQKSMDISADLANKLMQGSLENTENLRAADGIGTKVDLTV